MFPFLGILEHYVEFNINTIVTLEKLFGVRSFGGSIDHSDHHQYIFPVFLGKLGLPSVIRTITSTFLGCWALVTLALITCFQQDDHFIFLDVIAHVDINISSFQMALQDT